MKDVLKEIVEFNSGVISTVDSNNKAQSRFMELQDSDDSTILIGTSVEKNVYSQLKNNKSVSLAVSGPGVWYRITGDVTFTDESEYLLSINETLKGMYEGKEDTLRTFRINVQEINVMDARNGAPEFKNYTA